LVLSRAVVDWYPDGLCRDPRGYRLERHDHQEPVILIDQIDIDIARGLHPWDAVLDATTHRLRPIVLTAAAASLGMVPIAPEIFWGAMAYPIIGGLFVATLLTLLFLPAPLCRLVPRQRAGARAAGQGQSARPSGRPLTGCKATSYSLRLDEPPSS
jgi:hypothetical protein